MVQLSDDCFAHGGKLLRLQEALHLIERSFAKTVSDETAPLRDCLNRILAEDVVSEIDVPGRDNSAVDGYAVYFDDLNSASETSLPVVGRATAGHPFPGDHRRGQAVRVFTGALLPEGPDTVMMQEDCRLEGGHVIVRPGIKRGANRRRRGEDVTAGTTIIPAGQRLRPQDVALAAAIGCASLPVAERLKVGVFSTGDELAEPGEKLPSGAIYDSNRRLIAGIVAGWGCSVHDLGILHDDHRTTISSLMAAAESHDLLITSGGVSMGEEDHVKAAIEAQGRLAFWKLAIKPGRPVALGEIARRDGSRACMIGLPGNPVAAFVTLTSVGRAMVFRLMGAAVSPPQRVPVIAGFRHKKKKDRLEWVRATIDPDLQSNMPTARAFEREGAGLLSSLTRTQGLVEIPEDVTHLEPGQKVDFIPYVELF